MDKFFRYAMPVVFTLAIVQNAVRDNWEAVFWVATTFAWWGMYVFTESEVRRLRSTVRSQYLTDYSK